MYENHSKFLVEAAHALRRLAERSPEIARELRLLADDVDELASKDVPWDGDAISED